MTLLYGTTGGGLWQTELRSTWEKCIWWIFWNWFRRGSVVSCILIRISLCRYGLSHGTERCYDFVWLTEFIIYKMLKYMKKWALKKNPTYSPNNHTSKQIQISLCRCKGALLKAIQNVECTNQSGGGKTWRNTLFVNEITGAVWAFYDA